MKMELKTSLILEVLNIEPTGVKNVPIIYKIAAIFEMLKFSPKGENISKLREPKKTHTRKYCMRAIFSFFVITYQSEELTFFLFFHPNHLRMV